MIWAPPSIVYAGTFEGVFKTTDGGARWRAANNGLQIALVYAVAIDPTRPNIVHAGVLRGGVYESADAGANWAAINNGLNGTTVSALALDPLTPSIRYAGTHGFGVFQSTDGAIFTNGFE